MAVTDTTCDDAFDGRWERLGRTQLPGGRFPCDRYRWGECSFMPKLTLDFVCPVGVTPRRLFAIAWLQELAATDDPAKRQRRGKGVEGRFADKLTRRGIPFLRRLEQFHTKGSRGDQGTGRLPLCYDFFHAIFLKRRDGHYAVRRRFGHVSDIINIAGRGREKILVPEMEGLVADGVRGVTRAVEASCFRGAGGGEARSKISVASLPGRNALDTLLLDGAEQALDADGLEAAWHHVGAALIDGHCAFTGDAGVASDQDIKQFVRRMVAAHQGKKTAGFDMWFESEREKGFARLLGEGGGREAGGDLFRRLLWFSYVQMGRACGALMLPVWTSFCHSKEILPNARERALFRAMHMPQIALQGLPVAFLPPGLVSWVLPSLLERFWDEDTPGPDEILGLARLVGRYAGMNVERRSIDRRSKSAGRTVPADAMSRPASQTTSGESYEHLIPVSNTRCPACRGPTAHVEDPEKYLDDWIFVF